LKSFETSFHQDLNGDGVIGVSVSAAPPLTDANATSLAELGVTSFYRYLNSGETIAVRSSATPSDSGNRAPVWDLNLLADDNVSSANPDMLGIDIPNSLHDTTDADLNGVVAWNSLVNNVSIHSPEASATNSFSVILATEQGGIGTNIAGVLHLSHDFLHG
jgi:hypothetical protein